MRGIAKGPLTVVLPAVVQEDVNIPDAVWSDDPGGVADFSAA